MDIESLKELSQAIQDNQDAPERIKKAVADMTLYMDYLNTYFEVNAKITNQIKNSHEYAILNGERVYPNIGRKPLPLPDGAYREADGTIVIPIKQ
mgnify:CR=1 FL=1